MVPGSLKRTLKSKNGFIPSRVPVEFTLNDGHVYFFYNKGLYLNKRYNQLIEEMRRRGFKPNLNRRFPKEVFPQELYNDWQPKEADLKLIRERIQIRISEKPNWYRKTIVEEKC